MNWYLLLPLAVLVAATPLHLSAQVFVGAVTDVAAVLRVWQVPIRLHLRVHRDGKGHHITLMGGRVPDAPREAPPEELRRDAVVIGTLLRSNHARHLLLRGIRLRHLAVCLRLSLRDAAATALLTGAFTGLARLTSCKTRERIALSIRPDFLSERTTLQARCILFLHLGNLLGAAVMALTAYLLEAMEHRRHGRKED